jgi:1-deoxy-D-xylulose-5-phosphate reductoisomerase
MERVLASTPESHPDTIAEVLAADREARQRARELVNQSSF